MKRPYVNHRNNPSLLIAVLLLVAVVVVYRHVVDFDFIGYDDKLYITENTHLHGGISRESIAWAFTINEKIVTGIH